MGDSVNSLGEDLLKNRVKLKVSGAMSGAPRVRSMNVADSVARPVLGPTGNNKAGPLSARKPASKQSRKVENSPEEVKLGEEKKALTVPAVCTLSPKSHSLNISSVLRRHELLLHSNLSLNASCSSDASTDSFHSRASTGRLTRSNSAGARRKQYVSRPRSFVSEGGLESPPSPDDSQSKKSCTWVTPNTDPCYATFHDEEWGVPIHDDRKLFELLVLSGALAELTWPAILSKRHIFREVFADFDPIAVSKFNEKKIIAPGSTATSLLSELKLRAIIENARQISKVIDEFGSFDKYIWSFVNYKPIVSRFRYPRQVPVKTPKADAISKDLVRRGFRSVGPTVIYSFMQVAGITNDHLISCFRFQECIDAAEGKEENGIRSEDIETNDVIESKISVAIDELSFSSE
ncbi:GMP SYNTHASE [GLUTAMINE-HYDROLYZING] ISOFORM X1-RELATED [Salix koriyanagi]|uniref:GMP SYNTHASE [GLUTAMINE-HYDROLYZING] ISOFORM X1-RELATED n=2 Tax=Salix TaxID=40685 RepID=A0A9Q0W363_9ROSI|nr:GMP SYNTHASE [GLUTAMINE-HYDROLYZING] ISOFORM X1-RELATED [Salix koriyanagi]